MASSTLLHESFRTGYASMSMADFETTNQTPFAFNLLEHLDDIIADADYFKFEELGLMMDDSLELDLNAPIYRSRPLSPDSMFDLQPFEQFMCQPSCTDPLPCPPTPSSLPSYPPSNQQSPPGLGHVLQDSVVCREESPYRNIPTVVQDSLSEGEGEEEDDEYAVAAAAEVSGYGQRHPLNASTRKCDNIPRTIYTSSKTPPTAPRRVRRRKDQLWYFLLETLGNPKYNPNFIQWENKDLGIFRFIQSKKVAQLWGAKKNRSNMSYEYFARAMRHYYSRGIMHRVAGRRLVYQFGPKAENWKNYAQLVAITASSSPSSSPSSLPCSSPESSS